MAASNYPACLTKVLRYEGGYVNHPSDPGGPTNYGITIAVARANGYAGDMRSMPLDVAKRIYKAKYWDAVSGDALPAGLDLAVFDLAVNSGVGRASKMLASIARDRPAAEQIVGLCDARLAFLKRLKTWPTFGKGWSSRVADVQATALRMATAPAVVPTPKLAPTKAPTGGEATASGAVVVGGGAVAVGVSEGWGWLEWSLTALVLLAVCAAAFYGWRWWKARKARAAVIDQTGTQAVSDALSTSTQGSESWTSIGDQSQESLPPSLQSSAPSSEQLSAARLALSSAASPAAPSRQPSARKQPRKRSAKPSPKTRKRATSSRASKSSAVRKSSRKHKPKSRARNSKG